MAAAETLNAFQIVGGTLTIGTLVFAFGAYALSTSPGAEVREKREKKEQAKREKAMRNLIRRYIPAAIPHKVP